MLMRHSEGMAFAGHEYMLSAESLVDMEVGHQDLERLSISLVTTRSLAVREFLSRGLPSYDSLLLNERRVSV